MEASGVGGGGEIGVGVVEREGVFPPEEEEAEVEEDFVLRLELARLFPFEDDLPLEEPEELGTEVVDVDVDFELT